jgi:hypothetical protein
MEKITFMKLAEKLTRKQTILSQYTNFYDLYRAFVNWDNVIIINSNDPETLAKLLVDIFGDFSLLISLDNLTRKRLVLDNMNIVKFLQSRVLITVTNMERAGISEPTQIISSGSGNEFIWEKSSRKIIIIKYSRLSKL